MKYCCDELKKNIGYAVGEEDGCFFIGGYTDGVDVNYCPFCGKALKSGKKEEK